VSIDTNAARQPAAPNLPSARTVAGWRDALGESAQLWADGGRHVVAPGYWLALSGAKSVDYNVALCHGPEGATDLARALDEIRTAQVPAVIMVAGPALGWTNLLAGEGWVCVDAKPFMVMTDLPDAIDPAARRLLPGELPRAHQMLADVFDVALPLAQRAIPSVSATGPTREAWGLFEGDELVSCVGVVVVDRTVAVWSLATPAGYRRRGYGRRLMSTVLAAHHRNGATTAVLYASPLGVSMYQALGYRIVEYWQVWSRSRWVFPPV
jgi:ribosomal protein S18 acetylase RimI-like enzyme